MGEAEINHIITELGVKEVTRGVSHNVSICEHSFYLPACLSIKV